MSPPHMSNWGTPRRPASRSCWRGSQPSAGFLREPAVRAAVGRGRSDGARPWCPRAVWSPPWAGTGHRLTPDAPVSSFLPRAVLAEPCSVRLPWSQVGLSVRDFCVRCACFSDQTHSSSTQMLVLQESVFKSTASVSDGVYGWGSGVYSALSSSN